MPTNGRATPAKWNGKMCPCGLNERYKPPNATYAQTYCKDCRNAISRVTQKIWRSRPENKLKTKLHDQKHRVARKLYKRRKRMENKLSKHYEFQVNEDLIVPGATVTFTTEAPSEPVDDSYQLDDDSSDPGASCPL